MKFCRSAWSKVDASAIFLALIISGCVNSADQSYSPEAAISRVNLTLEKVNLDDYASFHRDEIFAAMEPHENTIIMMIARMSYYQAPFHEPFVKQFDGILQPCSREDFLKKKLGVFNEETSAEDLAARLPPSEERWFVRAEKIGDNKDLENQLKLTESRAGLIKPLEYSQAQGECVRIVGHFTFRREITSTARIGTLEYANIYGL